ncbi:Volume-regulated anion channel subunit [Nymphaea thermarum]|nr:Volume-regulated anion channel subunit [Nymphaea thermarum]
MKNIEAIQLTSGTYGELMYVEAESFIAMSKLRMLRLGKDVRLEGEFEHFPKALRWLQWCIEEHLDSLPDGLHLENIVVLDLSNSWITQLWNPQGLESAKVFRKMKVLKLTNCRNLTSCPDFERMPHLKKLDLERCCRMIELHPSIGHLKSLTHLTLRECASLKRVPQEIWQLTSLEELDLKGCSHITTLPSPMEDPESLNPMLLGKLKVLIFKDCFDLTICPDFTSMPHLQKLNFTSCEKMSELHPSIGHLKSLTHLFLGQCSSLKQVPQEIWQLTSLEELDLQCCFEITTLPLPMEDPKSLKQVLLGKLTVLNLNSSNITICPDFTSMPHLQILNFGYCKMSELHPSIGLLKSLIDLNLGYCRSLKELPLENWQLTSLEMLSLSGCDEIRTLPSQLGDSRSLACLSLRGCESLMELPESVCQLTSLKELDLNGCDQLEIIPNVSSLKGLQKLDLSYCRRLVNVLGIQVNRLWHATSPIN